MISNWTNIITSPRFTRLAKFFGSRAKALGTLALLHEQSFGTLILLPFRGAEDVEAAADWQGPAGELYAELTRLGFIVADKTDGSLSLVVMPGQDTDE